MKKLTLGAAFTAFSILGFAAPSVAADCVKNYVFKNVTDTDIRFKIESRTRANATWYSGGIKAPITYGGRFDTIKAGEQVSGTITYKIVGCSVKRKVRIKLTCRNPTTNRYVGNRVINVAQGKMHRVYDLKSDLHCNNR